jgi:DNA excision repair protein ERCC-4
MAAAPAPLQFYRDIDCELAEADTLVVMARGLGMASVLARFVVARVRPRRLILALNVSRDVAVRVLWPALRAAAAERPPANPELLLPRFVNADYSVADRASVYATGGFVAASATVLVHDLLCRKIPAADVDGIVVFAADRVRPNSNTHFVLTLFRSQNRTAFVKAVSENAPGLTLGFHHAEKVMRTLFVSRLSNWPRFRKEVKQSLSRRTPDVIDLSVPLSRSQACILSSLRDITNHVLADLRIATRSLDLTDVYRKQPATAGGDEAATPKQLVANFDDVIRRQLSLAPGQRRFAGGEKVPNLVSDLTSLRTLMSEVADLNSVTFYQHVLTLRHAQERKSYWLMRREAQNMLRLARGRIFATKEACSSIAAANAFVHAQGSKKRPRGADVTGKAGASVADACEAAVIVPVLDPSPKWKTLLSVIAEIEADVRKISESADVGRVVVAVKDKSTMDELRRVLSMGAKVYLRGLFEDILPTVAGKAAWSLFEEDNIETPNGPKQTTMTQLLGDGGSANRADARVNGSGSGRASRGSRQVGDDSGHARGFRRRSHPSPSPRTANDESCPWPWPVRLGSVGDGIGESDTSDVLSGLREFYGLATPENPAKEVEVLLWCLEWVDVQGRSKALLELFKPSFVVMYNADVAFVRQVEVYKAESPGRPVRLYLLAYEDTVDEDRYRDVLERERAAFKTLIRERATMLLHADQEGRLGEFGADEGAAGAGDADAAAVGGRALGVDRDSRLAPNLANGDSAHTQGQIIVDIRELRSSLPMALYRLGVQLLPVTLEVGDFVLSTSLAVERKSVPDLFGSFTSGRLFNQAESLCRHYKQPCLLIELEAGASVSLVAISGGVPSEIVPSSIVSRMVLLMQQFPRLRLLWAQGPQDGADLFLALKAHADQPDATVATCHGVDSSEGSENEFNLAPATLLRSLPGIDGNNLASVMRKVPNVVTLLNMSLKDLAPVLGSVGKAQMLYNFAKEQPSEALGAL